MRKLETFFFRYFSFETLNTKDSWVRYTWAAILTSLAMIACILNATTGKGQILILIFITLFTIFALLWILVFFYHNWRIKNKLP
jgi:hypothetical protein